MIENFKENKKYVVDLNGLRNHLKESVGDFLSGEEEFYKENKYFRVELINGNRVKRMIGNFSYIVFNFDTGVDFKEDGVLPFFELYKKDIEDFEI